MATKYTNHCDGCDKELKDGDEKHGFCAEIGYSINGWGSRKDFFRPFSAELCPKCFKRAKKKAKKFTKLIEEFRKEKD